MSDGKDPLTYWMERASLLQREINAICRAVGVDPYPALQLGTDDWAGVQESRVRLGLILLRISELKDAEFRYESCSK